MAALWSDVSCATAPEGLEIQRIGDIRLDDSGLPAESPRRFFCRNGKVERALMSRNESQSSTSQFLDIIPECYKDIRNKKRTKEYQYWSEFGQISNIDFEKFVGEDRY
eukprot:scaffold6004_cov229-Pinguiococcus_pyrenoidosus.AAC.1